MKKLENYTFIGLDASLVGAIKSVADYYQTPIKASWIYGMTGIAFLHIVDENLVKPNGGPPEQEVFRLVRNIGIEINGIHEYAEGEHFELLQAEAWKLGTHAIAVKQPVFAKYLDISNQTSVVYAYDEVGYYTHSWHHSPAHCDDVIPWRSLGLNKYI